MKLIIAYIHPELLEAVKQELMAAGVPKISIIPQAHGAGQQPGHTTTYRGHTEIKLRVKARLEIAVNDNFVQPTVDAIIKGARSGNIGDGKIFILPLEECIRIRDGQTGSDAIG